MKKIFNSKRLLEYLPYILVVLVIVLPWFFYSGYLFFTDFIVGPNIHIGFFQSTFIFRLLLKILSLFYFFAFGQKLFIALVLLVVLLGAKKLLEYFTDQKWLVFIVSLFFLFNPFIYDRIMYGQIGVVLSLGLLTWSFGFLLEYLKGQSFSTKVTKDRANKQLIWAGILMGLSIAFCQQAILFSFFIFILFIFLFLFKNGKKSLKIFFKAILVIGFLVTLLNSNWLIASFAGHSKLNEFVSTGITKQDLTAFQTIGDGALETAENVVMMSGFWGKEQNRYIDLTKVEENWGRSFLILLPLILVGVYMGIRKKKYRALTIGLVVLYIISVLLAIGIKAPVAREISIWLFDHLTIYRGFREPQKWVMLVVLVYGIFLVMGTGRLFKTKIIENNKVLVSIILAAIIIMQTPLMLWGMGGQIKPIAYPQDWADADKVIKLESYKVESGKCDKKILFLPWHLYMSFPWSGTISANPAVVFFTCDVIFGTNMEWGGIEDNSLSLEGKIVPEWITAEGKTDLLANNDLNIGYIVLAKTLEWEEFEWLDTLDTLELVKETETLKVYKAK